MKNIAITFLFAMIHIIASAQLSKTDKIDSLLTMLYDQNQFFGNILIAEHGKVIYNKSYGYSNVEKKTKLQPNTIFELASVSKQFTAMGIVILKEKGLLNYEDDLARFVPELSFYKGVKIKNLLNHTSGIPEYFSIMAKNWDTSKVATNEDVIKIYALTKDTLDFAPNSKHAYCNINYVLLASIIERISGQSYEKFMKKEIFSPLKMNHTFSTGRQTTPNYPGNFAFDYVWEKGTFVKIRANTSENYKYGSYLGKIIGDAGIKSSVGDLLKWDQSLTNAALLSLPKINSLREVERTTNGKRIPYAFGWDLWRDKESVTYKMSHTGHTGGYITYIERNLLMDRTIIILQNFEKGMFISDAINDILNNKPISQDLKKKIEIDDKTFNAYTGIYLDSANVNEKHLISYKDKHLIYNTEKLAYDLRFYPYKKHEFFGINLGGFDYVIRFRKNEKDETIMEMVQYGRVIGRGIKKKDTDH